jgi:hypothetical protein
LIDTQSSTHHCKLLPSSFTSTASSRAFGRASPLRTFLAHSSPAASLPQPPAASPIAIHCKLTPSTSVPTAPLLSGGLVISSDGLGISSGSLIVSSGDLFFSSGDLVVLSEQLGLPSKHLLPGPCPSLPSQGVLQLTLTLQVSLLFRQSFRPHTSPRKSLPPGHFFTQPFSPNTSRTSLLSPNTSLTSLFSPRPISREPLLSATIPNLRFLFQTSLVLRQTTRPQIFLFVSLLLPQSSSPQAHTFRRRTLASPSSPPRRHHSSQRLGLLVPSLTLCFVTTVTSRRYSSQTTQTVCYKIPLGKFFFYLRLDLVLESASSPIPSQQTGTLDPRGLPQKLFLSPSVPELSEHMGGLLAVESLHS